MCDAPSLQCCLLPEKGFASVLYDPDAGLTRFGFRDYDAKTGRWTAKDPILFVSLHRNVYVYSFNDPVSFTDLIGLKADANRDEPPTTVAEVVGVSGLPRIQRDGEGPWTPLMEGMHVNIGDVIEMGPETYLDFEFLSGTGVGMNENTTLQATGTGEVTDITNRSAVENLMGNAGELWNKITQPEGDSLTESFPMTIKE